MVCTVCSTVNTDGAPECANCKTPFDSYAEPATQFIDPSEAETVALDSFTTPGSPDTVPLKGGTLVGARYQLLKLLGEGGMGAVYKALDRELDRIVALKVIRPQFASEPHVLQRFKQELVLARQVTHRNVIRIFDLGVAEGIRFITMEYVEGRDLSSILKERHTLPPGEAVSYIMQICEGLAAAHAEGVIHRDLKPTNVMIDAQGRALIMDFGIARSMASSAMTRTGALMGTPIYMSPEQARATPVDARSDIYTLGIIFYELLTGAVPFKADSLMSTLLMRCEQKPVPPNEIDPSIPSSLNDIILKAMATAPADRYQSTREMLRDVELYQAGTSFAPASSVPPRTLSERPPEPPSQLRRIANIAVPVIAVLSMAAAAYLGFTRSHAPSSNATRKAKTVLVADFENTTSESVFDDALEPVFMTGMEGASFVNLFSRTTAHKLAEELKPGSSKLNEAMARSIAMREGINVVITGLVARQGNGYRVSVNAIDGVTGKTIDSRDSSVVKRDNVVKETATLVPKLRRAIGDVAPETQQVAEGETFTSTSLDALHDYGAAQQQQWAGNSGEAIKLYLQALKADAKFGRAYAGLASASANLGRSADAERYYKLALEQTARMSDRENLRTRGSYFLYMKDPKAIAEFTELVKVYPNDTAGQANLALASCYAHDMAKAMEEGRKAVDLEPKNTIRRVNLALYAVYAGDAATAAREARAAIALNAKYEKAYIALALSQILDGNVDEAAKTYGQLQGVTPRGASMASTGLADIAMYEGRFTDAASILEKGIAAYAADPKTDWAVAKLLMLAESQLAQNKKPAAAESIGKAMDLSTSDPVLFNSAQLLIRADQEDKAARLASQLAALHRPEPRAYAKVISAEILLSRQKTAEAIDMLSEAQNLTNTWIGHFQLARAYLQASAAADADSEIDRCLKRRGEATSLFLDDVQTVRYLPEVSYYQGRASEALSGNGNPKALKCFSQFLALKSKSQADPVVEDARSRVR